MNHVQYMLRRSTLSLYWVFQGQTMCHCACVLLSITCSGFFLFSVTFSRAVDTVDIEVWTPCEV